MKTIRAFARQQKSSSVPLQAVDAQGGHTLQLSVAKSFWARFRGLMLTPVLSADQGLLIPRCRSVHTLFMRYSLDIVYLDERGSVVRCVQRVRPWRVSLGGAGARHVLELAEGGIARYGMRPGVTLMHPGVAGCQEGER